MRNSRNYGILKGKKLTYFEKNKNNLEITQFDHIKNYKKINIYLNELFN